jgi:hypothetical protein
MKTREHTTTKDKLLFTAASFLICFGESMAELIFKWWVM